MGISFRAVYIDPFFKDSYGRAHPVVTRKKSVQNSLKVKVRRFTKSKKFIFWIGRKTYVFSKPEIKRLITDKLTRSAKKKSYLYRCRIFKRCNRKRKNKCKKKSNNNKCKKRNKNKKKGNKRTNEKKKKPNNLGRVSGIQLNKPKRKSEKKKAKESKKSLFRGFHSFLQS